MRYTVKFESQIENRHSEKVFATDGTVLASGDDAMAVLSMCLGALLVDKSTVDYPLGQSARIAPDRYRVAHSNIV